MQGEPHPTSDVTEDDLGPSRTGEGRSACLTLSFQSDEPLAAPVRFPLEGVDEVLFSRGKAGARAERAETGSGTTLRIEVPDRFLSSSHASLRRVFGRWVLEDKGSRNGTWADGRRIDRCELEDSAVVEIGHSFFLFRAAVPHDAVLTGGSLHAGFGAQLSALSRAAKTSLPVVLRGESGTGKEVLARDVHQLSGRSGAFQAINCAALSPALLESELFGYRKGAFSGALEDRPGLVRSADQGTLFLDEIGDLPAPAQGALLRVLQESEVTPVGGTRPVPVDFRLVVATHRSLEEMAAAGDFRSDLLARISGLTVWLPPLRERKEDLGALIASLLQRHAPGRALGFTPAAARALFLHAWPLNVRELEKTLLLALALAPQDGTIDVPHLPAALLAAQPPEAPSGVALGPEEAQRREQLLALLKEHNGNVTAVARVLGKARVQVQRWMRRYRITPAIFR